MNNNPRFTFTPMPRGWFYDDLAIDWTADAISQKRADQWQDNQAERTEGSKASKAGRLKGGDKAAHSLLSLLASVQNGAVASAIML